MHLFTALWEQNDIVGLTKYAEASVSRPSLLAPAHLALAIATEVNGGTEVEAAEHLALAAAFADLTDLTRIMPGALKSFQACHIGPNRGTAQQIALSPHPRAPRRRRVLRRTYAGGPGAVEALDRHSRYLSLAEQPDEGSLILFRWASERAWVSRRVDTAIVARQHLCSMLTKLGPSAQDRLAMETGWLAMLLKQQGRISEAEALYQQSIELGKGIITAVEMSSIIGRYANLLHQAGDFGAAVHLQWQAVRARKPHLELAEFPDLQALDQALTPAGIQDADASRWALLLANLTNCLKDSGHAELGSAALVSTKVALAHASGISQDPASDHNFREVLRMLVILADAFPQSTRNAQTVHVPPIAPEAVGLASADRPPGEGYHQV